MKPLAVLCLLVLGLSGGLAAQGQMYSSPSGFSLSVPDGWQLLTKEGPPPSQDVTAKTKFNPARMSALAYSPTDPHINLNVIVLQGAIPMDDDAAKGYSQMLQDQSAQAGVALQAFTVARHNYGGHNALLADYDMDFSTSNGPNRDLGKVHQWQVVFSGTSNTYVVTCSAGTVAFPTLAPVFERVLASMNYPGAMSAPALSPTLAPAPAAAAPAQPAMQSAPQAPVQAPTQAPAQAMMQPVAMQQPAMQPAMSQEMAPAPQRVDSGEGLLPRKVGDVRVRPPHPVHMYTPKDADVYCAGFITTKPPVSGLYVISGAEGGLQEIFTDRDTIYLSKGAGYIVRPGGDYILLRPIIDPNYRVEWFKDQNKLIKSLGTVYTEIGTIRVGIVHEYVATAKVTHTCEEIQPGDIAVPLDLKPTPPAPTGVFDEFAPATNKNDGRIVTGKNFEGTLGAGKTVYLSIGAEQGVDVGQNYRIFRTFATASGDPNRAYLDQTPQKLFGMRTNYKLSQSERDVLPRTVLGELVILSVNGHSATALITMSGAEIFPGDQVELK